MAEQLKKERASFDRSSRYLKRFRRLYVLRVKAAIEADQTLLPICARRCAERGVWKVVRTSSGKISEAALRDVRGRILSIMFRLDGGHIGTLKAFQERRKPQWNDWTRDNGWDYRTWTYNPSLLRRVA